MVVADYAFPPHATPDALKAAGITGVCRYLSWLTASAAPKVITAAEFQALKAAGIQIALNWEYGARDFADPNFDAPGAAREAVRQARAVGYPDNAALYYSVDYDVPASDWATIANNFRRVNAIHGVARTGIYGPHDALTWAKRDGVASWFWQAGMSTSWSYGRNAQLWPGAHLRQRRSVTIAGSDCDLNDIVQPNYGQHGGTIMADTDIPDTHRLASNADTWARAVITGENPAQFLGSGAAAPNFSKTENVLHDKLNQILAAVATPPAVTLSDADRAAIVNAVIAAHPALTDADAPVIEGAVRAVLHGA